MTQVDRPVAEAPAARLRQALVIRPDGVAEFTFVGMPPEGAITGTHRGVAWTGYALETTEGDNPSATAFAQSMGWSGPGTLAGTVVFVGDDAVEDVPGVLIAEAMRLWGDLPVN